MKSTQYSNKVLDHFRNPRNVGELEGNNVASGRVGNPVCGDLMEMFIKVEGNIITDIKFKTFGCGSAIATSSMITELAKGKSLDDALKITRKNVADELDGLPPIKMHCSNLAADALHEAIKNYLSKESIKTKYIESSCHPPTEIKGENEYKGKGVYNIIGDMSFFKDKRILILDNGDNSLEIALNLTNITGRVVVITSSKETPGSSEVKNKLRQSDVKIIYQSEIIEILGTDDVEKVKIHDFDEDEEYELFVDSVILLR